MERLPLPTLGWSKNLGSDDDAYGKTVIYKRIDTYFAAIYTGKCDKDGFKVGNVFDNYHYQVAIIMSHKAILACFFLSGLKRCFIFSPPRETITSDFVLSAILLAHGWLLSLLSAMQYYLQIGLRGLSLHICKVQEVKGKDSCFTKKTPILEWRYYIHI